MSVGSFLHFSNGEKMEEFEFEVPVVNVRGEVTERTIHRAKFFCEELGNGILLEMVLIPGGIFQMGSPPHQGFEDEHPLHPVSIAPFCLGKYLVTQEQWKAVMGKEPACRFMGLKRPVERVSWDDSLEYCRRLTKKTGHHYRLPSEAEWEYACKSHSAAPFYFGQTITTDLANYVGEHLFAAESKGIYRHGTTEVGSFPPNPFGLYDMHGNLWEWCSDEWHDTYSGAPASGQTWESKNPKFRVVRGGSWHEPPAHCRSTVRLRYSPADRDEFIGFRVALIV
jgi:eukaryotic-like serine/threonine-protein kinase